MAQVALAWLRQQTVPVIPIMGARKASQLQDNLASLDLELSAEQLKSLDGASQSSSDSPRVFTREKWFVQSGMAARGTACCSKCGTSDRIAVREHAFKLPACSQVTLVLNQGENGNNASGLADCSLQKRARRLLFPSWQYGSNCRGRSLSVPRTVSVYRSTPTSEYGNGSPSGRRTNIP